MKNDKLHDRQQLASDAARVEFAVRSAVRNALADHKRTGDPIVIFQDGEVRWVPAAEIRLPQVNAD